MSLNSLARSRVRREMSVGGRQPAQLPAADEAGDVQNALSALVEYVPAETITLYLAAAAAFPVLQRTVPALTPLRVYIGFVLLTPVLFALIYAGKRKAQLGSRWPGWKEWKDWPAWPMIAATLAFAVWALAAPNRPFLSGEDGGIVVGLLALVVSVLLGVVARFIGAAATDG